jgi:hypothetical protein
MPNSSSKASTLSTKTDVVDSGSPAHNVAGGGLVSGHRHGGELKARLKATAAVLVVAGAVGGGISLYELGGLEFPAHPRAEMPATGFDFSRLR